MNIPKPLAQVLTSSFFLSFVCFILFLSMTSYKFGWDDQHLEIPLLKSLIDPTLYQGDYYVESLKKNFTSYFFPILSKLITVDQIPATYHLLWLLSRFFMIFWIYKLWLLISKNKLQAVSAVMVFILMARVQEFLYRTFSHQEFALAIIFAGIYYFFKDRIILAAILLGIAANFHALYSLFPMLFICLYLFLDIPKRGISKLLKAGGTFALFSLPFLIWMVQNRIVNGASFDVTSFPDWLNLFLRTCPPNFFFGEHSAIPWAVLTKNLVFLFEISKAYVFLTLLFVFNLMFNEDFRLNKKAVSFSLGCFILLVFCLMFTYFWPKPFFIDLNLERNTQFLLFLLMGFTTIYLFKKVQQLDYLDGLVIGLLFAMLKFNVTISIIVILMYTAWMSIKRLEFSINKIAVVVKILCGILLFILALKVVSLFNGFAYSFYIYRNLTLIYLGLIAIYFIGKKINNLKLKPAFLLLPLFVFLFQYMGYHNTKLKEELYGQGFWKLQRNWEDMQRFVKSATPKDSIVFIPYNMEMGGFRIFSERKVVVCYRDCGIIGFDFKAAVEWQNRIKDVEAYKVNIDSSINAAIMTAITKYHASYIVFLNYAAPKNNSFMLKRVYTNDDFALFEVNVDEYKN